MPFIPESRFFRGKVHSRKALRFGLTGHQALRDLRCSGPPANNILQTDKTLLSEGRGAGSVSEVTREVEGELSQGGAQSQRRGSDTVEVSNDFPGIVLLKYEMRVQTLFYKFTRDNSLTITLSGYKSFY